MPTHEEDARAIDAARNRMPMRFQKVTNHDTIQTTERLNRMEAFLVEQLGYDDNDAEKIFKKQETAFFEKNLAEEKATILQQNEHYVEITDASFSIFMEIFAPFAYGERLAWDSKLKDDETGSYIYVHRGNTKNHTSRGSRHTCFNRRYRIQKRHHRQIQRILI